MAISETKMQMVIANYFKDECDVNTSIRQAFEKGFRIGVKKGASTNRPQGEWLCSDDSYENAVCSNCGFDSGESYVVVKYEQKWKACPMCEARMRGAA